jgi:hypothetical protein
VSNQRPSFAKRDREMKLKDKARAKAERRAAKRAEAKARTNDPNDPNDPNGSGAPVVEGEPASSTVAVESPDSTPT